MSPSLILIGASTGGTDAIREVLMPLPSDLPPIAITQHMPPGFTRSFAERLDRLCQLCVIEAQGGERLERGHVYLAPGDAHLRLSAVPGGVQTVLGHDEPINRHRPSVEALFLSAAALPGARVLALMLTGMGRDGALAMKRLREAGAYNLVQDEASSVVFGMPREAIACGAAHEVLPLSQMAARVIQLCQKGMPERDRSR
jgi:two-component system chemotaxis response regulator CheB